MEAARIEFCAERSLCLGAQAADGELAQLVGQGLAGPADVAIDLGPDLVQRQRGVRREIIDRLLAGPAVAVQAGVDHEARRAPHFVALLAEPLVGRAIDAHLDPEPFGVQAPTLAIAGKIQAAAEARERFAFFRQCRLEAVAGGAFMKRQRGDVVERAAGEIVGVHLARLEPAAPGGIEGRECVGHRDDREPAARQDVKIILELPVDALGGIGRDAHQFVRRSGDELRVGAQEFEEFGEAAGKARLTHGALHVGVDASDFLEADLVDFLRGQRQRDIFADFGAVISVAIGQVAGGNGFARAGEVGAPIESKKIAKSGDDGLLDRGLALGAEFGLVGGGDVAGHDRKGFEESVGFGGNRERADRSLAAGKAGGGRGKTTGHAGAHVGDLLGEMARHIAHPGDVAAVGGGIVERRRFVEIGPEIAVRIDRHLPLAKPRVGEGRYEDVAQHGSIGLLFQRQASDGDCVEFGKDRCEMRGAGGMARGVDLGQIACGLILAFGILDRAIFLRDPH